VWRGFDHTYWNKPQYYRFPATGKTVAGSVMFKRAGKTFSNPHNALQIVLGETDVVGLRAEQQQHLCTLRQCHFTKHFCSAVAF
jgi:hypothetical protein